MLTTIREQTAEASSSCGREDRLAHIVDAVNHGRFISLRDIANRFGVNIQTARRDIDLLAERKLVTRVYGGAVQPEAEDALAVEDRLGIRDSEKRRIAELAASFIQDGDVIFLDGGSTTAYLPQHILDKRILVVTNAVSLAEPLKRGWPNLEVIVTGGYYYPKDELLLGPPALKTIQDVQINKVFLSAAGVTAQGVFNSNMLVVELERAVIAQAMETYLLVDPSKLGRTSLVRVCGFEDIDKLVTIGQVPEVITDAAKSGNCSVHACTM